MIIVSQGREDIYNFDNVKSIDIVENEIYITDDILADRGVKIGEYATEERAKKVLRKIMQCYTNTEQYKCFSNNSNKNYETLNYLIKNSFIYEMPEE